MALVLISELVLRFTPIFLDTGIQVWNAFEVNDILRENEILGESPMFIC